MLLVNLFIAYFGIGLLFAIAFALRGASAIDQNARGTSIWFRLIIIPGAIALWPFLLLKWVKS